MKKLKLIKNVKALSRLSIIILLIASLIVGALLSYLWVMGYYLTLGIKIPENTTLSISEVSFSNQNTFYFNVTFFNPSYSFSAVSIARIAVKTQDDKLININTTFPGLPYTVPEAQDAPFQCEWAWAAYKGQNIEVMAFVDSGSGPTYKTKTPLVDLRITEARFNSSISVSYFNLTVLNFQDSVTYVNISEIVPSGESALTQIFPSLPFGLEQNKNQTFKCTWDWTNYLNKSITITVRTVQGYTADYTVYIQPLIVEITNVTFSEPDITHFNVTARNRKESSNFVNITKVAVTLENGTVKEINGTEITPGLPYKLDPNSTITFKCPWDWTRYRGKNAIVSIFTVQNYTVRYSKATPSPIEITNAIFDAANTNSFNVTVRNSALYYTSVNITSITLTFENGTVKNINGTTVSPQLPYNLTQGSSVTLRGLWNWTGYQGRNVTITVGTAENYIAQLVKVTQKRVILTITSISFDSISTGTFNVIVRNSALSLESASITKVTVTFENGTVIEVPSVAPSLPYLLNSGLTATFTCQWDWSNYRGKNITITVYAAKGYVTSSLYTTPPLQ
jgi:hypothetical protein